MQVFEELGGDFGVLDRRLPAPGHDFDPLHHGHLAAAGEEGGQRRLQGRVRALFQVIVKGLLWMEYRPFVHVLQNRSQLLAALFLDEVFQRLARKLAGFEDREQGRQSQPFRTGFDHALRGSVGE